MSPGDPALYGLATTESSRWNELAAGWLAEGYDSQLLRAFATRCQTAMAVVQRDLERTGRGEFRLHPVDTTPWDFAYETTLQACAALPDGTYSIEFNNPMTPDLDDAELLVHAAA